MGSVGAVVRLDQHGWVLSTQHPLLLVLQGTSQRQEAPKSEAKVGELRAGSGEVEGEGQTGGSFQVMRAKLWIQPCLKSSAPDCSPYQVKSIFCSICF